MIDALLANVGQTIQQSPWMGIVAVFVGGVLTAASPCVLAMIPLMMSIVAGRREEGAGVGRAFAFSLVFALGLAITFTVLGMVAALAGRMYGSAPPAWNFVVAGVCALMGLHLAGVIRLPIPALGSRVLPRGRGLLSALVLGLLFGLVSAPCAAPVLVVLLTYLAGSGASVVYGGLLLLVYALGHSVLVIVAGTSMGAARTLIENKKMTRWMEGMRRGAGILIVLVGVYFGYRGFA